MSKRNWKFSYAGIELPPPEEGGITVALQPVDDAERNANGDMFIQPIADKITVQVSWGRLRGNEAKEILSALGANRTGALVFYKPISGRLDSIEAYYGTGASVQFVRYNDELEKQVYSSLKVNFNEM